MSMYAELHDGRKLEFPDGTDPAVIQATVKRVLAAQDAPKQLAPGWEERMAISATRAQHPVLAGVMDFGTAATGLARGALNLLPGNIGDKLSPAKKYANPESGASLAGSLADPVALAAFSVGGPLATIGGKGFIGGLGALGKNALRGAAAGGVVGGLSETGDAKTGATAGAVANTVLPPVVRGIGRGIGWVAGRGSGTESARKLLTQAAGADLPAVKSALKAAPPGITGAQAVAGVKSDAMDAVLAIAAGGDKTSAFSRKYAEQQAARVQSIEAVTPDYKAAVAARKAASDPLYAAARNAGDVVNTSTVLAHIDSLLLNQSGNPPLVAALKQLRGSLTEEVSVGGTTVFRPIRNSGRVASAVDGLKTAIDKKASPQNAHIAGTLHELKNELVNVIPGYAKADAKFAQLSAPVNQATLLGAMKEKLVGTGGTEGAKPFLSVLGSGEDALLKKSTGGARFGKIEDVLTPDQMSRVRGVEKDLERNLSMKRGAGAGAGGAGEIIQDNLGKFALPNWINGKIAISNRFLKFMESRVGKKAMETIRTADLGNVPGKTLNDVLNSLPIEERNRFVAAFYHAGRDPAFRASLSSFSKISDQQEAP